MANIERELKSIIEQQKSRDVLIHSDLMWGFNVQFDRNNREKCVSDHYEKISSIFEEFSIIMPSFNYKYLPTKEYNTQAPSQVGVLSEYFRSKIATWRTLDPVFSFSGTKHIEFSDPIKNNTIIDPFGPESFFNTLYVKNSLLLHYGSELKHTTLIHYIERKLGAVPYRYDKLFNGSVSDGNDSYNIQYKYHVRPMGKHLDYNWNKIANELTAAGIYYSLNEGKTRIGFCNIQVMVDYLYAQLIKDPFYLLDDASKEWIFPKMEELGRNFMIQDFE